MKRVIITILIFLFGIGCGFGAFFMLKTGGNMKKEELKSVQRLEVPKTETKASKEQKKKEEPKNSEQVKEKDDVPNFGTQEEKTKTVEEILSGPSPKTGEESRILVFSVLLGMSVTVMGGTIYRIKMKKGANGTL